MAFTKAPNVAQYQGADWSNFKKRVPNCTPAGAQRIAMRDPSITFFFYCRDPINLRAKGSFNRGDAVFFTGQPWYGSAPQCDAYQKDFFNVAYFDSKGGPFRNVGCYVLENGRPFFDVAVLFAANIKGDPDKAVFGFNDTIRRALESGDVKRLQDLGITVLLSVLGDHDPAGWSAFPNEESARDFARQLADCVDKYGLDGIDIDDEYSCYVGSSEECANPSQTNDSSLIMATSTLRTLRPEIIISKALCATGDCYDLQRFSATWNGKTLAQQLSYGWEMRYNADGGPDARLQPYSDLDAAHRLQKRQLVLGVSNEDSNNRTPPEWVKRDTAGVKDEGYGGMLVFETELPDGPHGAVVYASDIAQVLYGQKATIKPGCWS